MLEMKPICERCGELLREGEVAFICSYECTFCETCAQWFQWRCPNCTSELTRRPRRGWEEPEAAVPLI